MKLKNIKTNDVFSDKLTYIYVELTAFNKQLNELKTTLDKWIFALKNMQKLFSRPAEMQGRVFEKLFTTAEIAKFEPSERLAYEQSIHAYRDIANGMAAAEERGRKEGREEGRKEERLKIARSLLATGMKKEQVLQLTQLSAEELQDE